MIESDLNKVYINFDPLMPLPGDSEFYVERPNNPMNQMKTELLRDSPRPPKFLFSGHRGSGKSTELNRLMVDREVQDRYLIVHYSIKEVLDVAGLEYTDVLFSIGAQVFIKATEDGKLKLRRKLLDELKRWIGDTEIVKEEISKEGAEVETQAGLSAFFIKVLGKLKVEYTSREKIRQTIKLRLSELINVIDLIIAEVELRAGKKVLVAIEDLDKPDLSDARDLFYERQTSLTLPNCRIIYTVPIALLYSPDAGQVRQAFDRTFPLPNVTIAKREDRNPDEEGRAVMREFIAKRMSLDLIEEDALEHAIVVSGGVFREMARIIRTAADNAIARGEEKIQKRDVQRVESEIRNEFRRMLEAEDYDALKEIYQKRDLTVIGSKICAKLLHNLSILEYQDDENWCDVHPAIIPLIEG